mmetsp:Transcript_2293/g.3591  ORF Transcript_2293/g.3591 Transcript_2293/m.3591 type:complete len:349 (-) Transcript_2293:672-1718(-)
MIREAESKEDPMVQQEENTIIGTPSRTVLEQTEEHNEETKESEELVSTAVLVEDTSFAAILVEGDIESAIEATVTTAPEHNIIGIMNIERVVMDRPENPSRRKAHILVEAALVQKETLQGLCRNGKVQILLLLVVVVTVSLTVGIVLGAVPSSSQNYQSETNSSTPPPPRTRLNRDAFIQNVLPGYTRAGLENETSPQSQAFEWLWEGDDPSLPIWRQVQRFALETGAISLTTSTASDAVGITELQEARWLTLPHECTWLTNSARAVVCDSLDHYQVLDLSSFGLAGTIPPEVALLADLVIMNLSGNSGLHGILPSEVGFLTRMEQFILEKKTHFVTSLSIANFDVIS